MLVGFESKGIWSWIVRILVDSILRHMVCAEWKTAADCLLVPGPRLLELKPLDELHCTAILSKIRNDTFQSHI